MSVIDAAVDYKVITYNKNLIEVGKGQELIIENGMFGKWFTIVDYIMSENDINVSAIKCPYQDKVIVCKDVKCVRIEDQFHNYKTDSSLCWGNVKCLTGLIGKLYIVEVEQNERDKLLR